MGMLRHCLGEKGWELLHPIIQQRFDRSCQMGAGLYYRGTMHELRCAWLLCLVGRLILPFIRSPLVPFNGVDIPVNVHVYVSSNQEKIVKERVYYLRDRLPFALISSMQASKNGTILEHVGWGLGVELQLNEKNGGLEFVSKQYFWEVGRWCFRIPDFLTPGRAYILHSQLENPQEFGLHFEVRHPLFGVVFLQHGVFQEYWAR
jgi:Domain of unknown function (DUF4166)